MTSTRARFVIIAALLLLILGPALVSGSGFALIVPLVLIFWLAFAGQALGLPVAKDGAVDAFNLVPPSWLGVILIVIGGGLSFWAIYRLSGTLARWWSEPGRAGRG